MPSPIRKDNRDSAAKVRLFGRLFSGRQDVYGTYDPASGRVWQVKKPVTDEVRLKHLTGRQPYGVYLLTGDRTRAVVADFDHADPTAPLEFVSAARHYGLSAYVEISKSRGFHAWAFADEGGVGAAKARAVFLHIIEEIDHPETEIFPKQDAIDAGSGCWGNFINAPLFGGLVPQGRTVFVDIDASLCPYPNQWEFLDSVESVSETILDEIIEINDIPVGRRPISKEQTSLGVFKSPVMLPPCARRMLEEGVTGNQRVACFRLAVHFRKVGLPYDLAVAALSEWSRKNRPVDGKRIITHCEIKAQVASAFLKEYRGCGCAEPAVQPFCDPSCPISPRRHVAGGKDA